MSFCVLGFCAARLGGALWPLCLFSCTHIRHALQGRSGHHVGRASVCAVRVFVGRFQLLFGLWSYSVPDALGDQFRLSRATRGLKY